METLIFVIAYVLILPAVLLPITVPKGSESWFKDYWSSFQTTHVLSGLIIAGYLVYQYTGQFLLILALYLLLSAFYDVFREYR